mmetsp:Transcript_21355/g.51798  ORF Transcript_21355/g.51798 Transcript_21355/m.51798 type:complete len:244 (-) Transcript_21355:11-742(-)
MVVLILCTFFSHAPLVAASQDLIPCTMACSKSVSVECNNVRQVYELMMLASVWSLPLSTRKMRSSHSSCCSSVQFSLKASEGIASHNDLNALANTLRLREAAAVSRTIASCGRVVGTQESKPTTSSNRCLRKAFAMDSTFSTISGVFMALTLGSCQDLGKIRVGVTAERASLTADTPFEVAPLIPATGPFAGAGAAASAFAVIILTRASSADSPNWGRVFPSWNQLSDDAMTFKGMGRRRLAD